MSAIIDTQEFFDGGIKRYHTSVKVEIAGHDLGRINLSEDVVMCSIGKTVKGVGRANVTLTAAKNYLNIVRPNDYINIYFDVGDGQGWTRTFFGLVDRIEEDFKVNDNGQPQTMYHVICTDFAKVFEKIFIYFNPALAMRGDWINSDFAQGNIGGLASLSRGIVLSGSPADFIQNFILVMLGFGTQMVLPDSYRPRVSSQFRQSRANFIRDQLDSVDLRNAVDPATLGTLRQALEQSLTGQGTPPTEEELATIADTTDPLELDADELRARALRNLAARSLDTGGDFPAFLMDILDIYTFVERKGIDGARDDLEAIEITGDLSSAIRERTNEVVNELFFDLRAVSENSQLTAGQDFSRDADDWGGNIDDNRPAGIQYVPALVMREYPFSTIEKIDASNVSMRLSDEDSEDLTFGLMWFGAIFSNEPNVKGRHIVRIPSVAVAERRNPNSMADKHLDVAVVKETEIKNTRFGRSDEDHFNLFELRTNGVFNTQQEGFLFSDLLPLITPIDIMRHGLRIRAEQSQYVYFGDGLISAGAVAPSEEDPEEEEETSEELTTVVSAPISAEDSAQFDCVFHAARTATGSVRSRYGYRQGSEETGLWIFHNGIDIGVRRAFNEAGVLSGNGIKGPPVRAIADGYVCVSAPNSTYSMYGECVVIRHPQLEIDGKTVYSSYHHLHSRNTEAVGNAENHKLPFCSSLNGGRFQELFVRRGTIIGYMGKTGASREGVATGGPLNPDAPSGTTGLFRHNLPHLHFEIDFNFPPRNDAATPRIPYSGGARPEGVNPRSYDPDRFMLDRGIDLQALYADDATATDYVDGAEGGGEDAVTDPTTRDAAVVENTEDERATTSGGSQVDGRDIRNMLARWTLLQDHWYQHNKEYLSGSITMRPAPEIRVGYRLDLEDRNLSFYVEGVQHDWEYGGSMHTTLQVTRGQPNDPYPVYVMPPIEGLTENPGTQRRDADSRLAKYFVVSDPIAVRRALILKHHGSQREYLEQRADDLTRGNQVDIDAESGAETVIPAETQGLSTVQMDQQLAANEALEERDTGIVGGVAGLTTEDIEAADLAYAQEVTGGSGGADF